MSPASPDRPMTSKAFATFTVLIPTAQNISATILPQGSLSIKQGADHILIPAEAINAFKRSLAQVREIA